MQQANTNIIIRNPFGTMDVPGPDGADVMQSGSITAVPVFAAAEGSYLDI